MKLLCAENQGRRLAYEGYTVATGHKRFLSVIDRRCFWMTMAQQLANLCQGSTLAQ
jgi:hypothetical protein